ncbi:MAG: hypothetical protein LUC98_01140 [Lachnospiraceae bacterium]|nr:hypothetical protein [Lachnospiraceae bacterium]
MWYVIQVLSGTEEDTLELLRKQISEELLRKCFVFYYEGMRKYSGEWHKQKKLLFPGYVFVITDQINDLYLALRNVRKLTRILGDRECFIPLVKQRLNSFAASAERSSWSACPWASSRTIG